jgi:hypothetical protein
MTEELATQDEGVAALLAFVYSGAIGSPKGKGVGYALAEATAPIFTWVAALEDIDGPPAPIDRYRISFNRRTRKILPPTPVVLSEQELAEAIQAATGHHLASSTRFTDGALSISYKIEVKERSDIAYILQLRHHGRVASMDALMTLISKTVDLQVLPLPQVYPIPGEMARQQTTEMGRQIARFVPGIVASSVYPRLSHKERLLPVRRMALAFQACWKIELPESRLIGELTAYPAEDGAVTLDIEPDRHHGLGGPFHSVRDYLRAYIRSSLVALQKQQEIKEYKARFLHRIEDFVKNRLDDGIPAVVEDIPVVAVHADMGLHNVIVSEQTPTEIQAVIDWEFVSSAPYASLHRIIEMLFRRPAPNGFGAEYDGAGELRDAFWGAIPDWAVESERGNTRVSRMVSVRPVHETGMEAGRPGARGEGLLLAREHSGCGGHAGQVFEMRRLAEDVRYLPMKGDNQREVEIEKRGEESEDSPGVQRPWELEEARVARGDWLNLSRSTCQESISPAKHPTAANGRSSTHHHSQRPRRCDIDKPFKYRNQNRHHASPLSAPGANLHILPRHRQPPVSSLVHLSILPQSQQNTLLTATATKKKASHPPKSSPTPSSPTPT